MIIPASCAVVYDYYGALRNSHGPELLRVSKAAGFSDRPRIWVVTISQPLKIRSHRRKASRWREAQAELEELQNTLETGYLETSYNVTEAYESYAVRVVLLSRE